MRFFFSLFFFKVQTHHSAHFRKYRSAHFRKYHSAYKIKSRMIEKKKNSFSNASWYEYRQEELAVIVSWGFFFQKNSPKSIYARHSLNDEICTYMYGCTKSLYHTDNLGAQTNGRWQVLPREHHSDIRNYSEESCYLSPSRFGCFAAGRGSGPHCEGDNWYHQKPWTQRMDRLARQQPWFECDWKLMGETSGERFWRTPN